MWFKKRRTKKSEAPPQSSRYDPLGMYTGAPSDGSAPVQDADDL
jgi:hypothetical protein